MAGEPRLEWARLVALDLTRAERMPAVPLRKLLITARSGWAAKDRGDFDPVFADELPTLFRTC